MGNTKILFIVLGIEASMTNTAVLFFELYNNYYVNIYNWNYDIMLDFFTNKITFELI